MPENKYQYFHIVIRPLPENLPDLKTLTTFIDDLSSVWCIASEKGSSTIHNHYDIWIMFKTEKRAFSIKRKITTQLMPELSEIEKKNIKVYGIDLDRIWYQLGYTQKEGDFIYSGLSYEDLLKGNQEYEKLKTIIKPEKCKNLTVDEIAETYRDWMIEHEFKNPDTYWKHFRQQYKGKIKFSTFQKIRKESLFEWLEGEL